ncbi:alpha/beta fold hydrolase [Actinoplanes sp. NPDC049599]|uniref:alpha/beta fold hydrolase n=1 Tax=Actinoplanes sp. NPDC049599 TaxID=3363903 RepID=UPI003793DE2F
MLAHERRGSGPPLVLIHGLGSRRQVWDPIVAELARHREVITLDLPGFGESPLWPAPGSPTPGDRVTDHGAGNRSDPGPRLPGDPAPPGSPRPPSDPTAIGDRRLPGDPAALGGSLPPSGPRGASIPDERAAPGEAVVPGSVGHLADQVAAFLDQLGLDRPELAGSSLGGGIALELGRRGRARAVTAFAPVGFWGPVSRRWCQAVVGGARLLSTALGPALPRLLATRAGRVALCAIFYGHPGRLSPEDCLASARALSRAPGFAAARRAFGVWRLPIGADPGALGGIPVTIVWGTRDVVLPYRRQAARAGEELPGARHVLLQEAGHLPFADDPVRCAELLTVRQ